VSDQVAQYVIRARDEASSVFDKLAGGLSNLSGSMVALGRAAGPLGIIATTLATIGTTASVGAVKLADEVEQLDRLASTSGVSVDKLQAMQQVLKDAGGDADGLPTALVKLNRAIQDGEPMLARARVTSRDTFTAFMQLADSITSTSDAKLRDEAAMKLLGKAGADLIPDLEAIERGFKGVYDQMERNGGLLKPDALDAARNLDTQMDTLSRNWGVAMTRMQSVTVGPVSTIISAFNDMWSAISGESAKPGLAELDRRIAEAEMNIRKLLAEANAHGDQDFNRDAMSHWVKLAEDLRRQRAALAGSNIDLERLRSLHGDGSPRPGITPPPPTSGGVSAFDIAQRGWFVGNDKMTPTDRLNAKIAEGAESSKKALQSMGKVLEELPVPALKLTDAGIKAMQSIELWEQTTQHFAYSVAADMQSVGAELLIGSTNIRAAWHELMKSILNDITSSAAEYGVGLLLDFIPIPGVDKLGDFGKNGFTAQSATAGGTNVFNINTLNAKDMVQEIVSPTGSIRRANDYVRAVSRAGR